jgi:flagellar protein FlbD
MIKVTRLNGKPIVVNAELIRFIEQTPDTLITLTSGDKLLVKEPMDEIVQRAIEYARSVRNTFGT